MKKFTKEQVEEIESLWAERHNALVRKMVNYCKKLQYEESKIYYNPKAESPVIHALDQVILELGKHII